jgi:SAM-dependent methyltransferase
MSEQSNFSEVRISQVRDFWNSRPCNVRHSAKPIGTADYFADVRHRKYFVEPHIPRFAEFERWRGKRVLEIGCGIGCDSVSFAAAGASVTAVDLSENSLDLARQHAVVRGLADRIEFVCADAESLTAALPPAGYDLIYSFGVIHHTPHPDRALDQLRHYARPGTVLKLMLYHRRSWKVLHLLATSGQFRIRGLDEIIARHSEAQTGCPVTYTYSYASARKLLIGHGFQVLNTYVDHIFPYQVSGYVEHRYVKKWFFRYLPPPLFRWMERHFGWHLCITARA